MALSSDTAWTSLTFDVVREHPTAYNLAKRRALCDRTVNHKSRMLSRQEKATEGVRHLRLDTWYHIRKLRESDVLAVLREDEVDLRPSIRVAMAQQALYHVVVVGDDPKFMPPGDHASAAHVTAYFCENMQTVFDEVDKYLFDRLENPGEIKEVMENPAFDGKLQAYYESGAAFSRKRKGGLVAYMHGSGNLLHTCIKGGHVDTLRLLLERYTPDSLSDTPWRILAEPLRAQGKFRTSAFHRAVYDGRSACLAELIAWARRHGHDITTLRNTEERSASGEPSKELTCLDLADQEKNIECYNMLADIFAAGRREGGVDRQTRESRQALLPLPRVELVQALTWDGPAEVTTFQVNVPQWNAVLCSVHAALAAVEAPGATGMKLRVSINCVKFTDDITLAQSRQLLAATAHCASLVTHDCIARTDRTLTAILEALVERLSDKSVLQLPTRLHMSCPVAERLEVENEKQCDNKVEGLLRALLPLLGQRPDFLGARNGVINAEQRHRLRTSAGHIGWPSAWAAVYASRIASFVGAEKDLDAGIEEWLRQRELMPFARAVYDVFYDSSLLLSRQPSDPREAMDPSVATFIEATLASWFALARDEENAWVQWGVRLGLPLYAAEEVMLRQLAPALDLVLDTLLRMEDMLNYAWKRRTSPAGGSVTDCVRRLVPSALMERLPSTRQLLLDRSGGDPQPPRRVAKISLTSATGSLRPSWQKH